VDVLELDKEFTPAMLALSAMFMLQDQEQKARNMLKRVVKMPYLQDQGEAFEKAYLALASSYMDKAKFDLAQVCDPSADRRDGGRGERGCTWEKRKKKTRNRACEKGKQFHSLREIQ